MFEYPKTQASENLKEDVQEIRRWLSRFVPELEQQLADISTDNFMTDYNERAEGLTQLTGAGAQKTTAGAVAEHLLDRNNPHGVTLSQLGALRVVNTENGQVIHLCGLMFQVKKLVISAGEAQAIGNVFYRDVSLGDWDVPFSAIYTEWVDVNSMDQTKDCWLGARRTGGVTGCGRVRLYSAEAAQEAVRVNIYGIGRA
jgi:hypothetical protein